ncbi:hypothetical protein, partial [Shewanella algae]|uniref:hypothetical protein n=1 Tax=Shewanella algae TaxID=38313 RepID=UPI0031F54590
TLFKKVGKAVLNRHKKSETYKQVSDCLSSGGSVNRSLSDLRCAFRGLFSSLPAFTSNQQAFGKIPLASGPFCSLHCKTLHFCNKHNN